MTMKVYIHHPSPIEAPVSRVVTRLESLSQVGQGKARTAIACSCIYSTWTHGKLFSVLTILLSIKKRFSFERVTQ